MSTIRLAPLDRKHGVESFDCGREPLNLYLWRHALHNHASGAGRTYVALSGDEVVGYYTLAAAHADYDDVPERLAKGMARYPIPLMLLARLAVATSWQGTGVGRALLRHAMLRTLSVAEIAGIRAMAIDAKDDAARAFYERFGFVSSSVDANRLFLLIKDMRASL